MSIADNLSSRTPSRPMPLPREGLAGLSGADTLKRMLAGDLPTPPFAPTTCIELVEAEAGRVVFVGSPGFAFLNPLGTIHGGWISTILDSAMGCAVHSMLEPGQLYTTTSMTINFVRALTASSGRVRCEATAVHTGRRLATSEGRLVDDRGRLVAHGSETCMILDATG
ncbi:MAG: PaaI family thioesterase [Rhizobiaceae bacterium]